MGIPAFYRWLLDRCPLAAVDVIEEAPVVVNGVSVPVDSSLPNPNGIEFDNLYLDMNGIVHPCFHPEGLPAPETYEEVFKAVFKYIDRIFSMIRPRKLLFMAIDGVAPRAKMNQQRSRRFRAAKDAADELASKAKKVERQASRLERLRGVCKSAWEEKTISAHTKKLDSNVITPGTEFMSLLSLALQYYVRLRLNMDPGWRGIKVILSDASVPGEGEHKIMSYIRLQRNLPGFDPNTRHCLYGLDADLIMLALATHEIHFSILREDVRKAHMGNRGLREALSRQGKASRLNLEDYIMRQKFQFLHVWVLRDYLAYELRIPDPTVTADLERLIDDFVFMCMFVGNDFLPHVPSLEISQGAIDLIMVVYKKEFVKMGGYLTNSFEVKKERDLRFASHTHSGIEKIQSSINQVNSDGNHVIDQVKLGEEGWKERYYSEKFEANSDDDREKIRRHSVLKYIEGICWVMHYYYQGVCSWQWFYPYHYAPFASDFYGLDQLEINFTLGKPFKPFDQLMGVLPAASAHALPFFYRNLMTDLSSPILDFYPTDFELDMNGKRFPWQAICKLPFIKESRLLSEIAKVEHTLKDEEKQRNSLGLDMLFVYKSHPLAKKIFSFYKRNKDHPKLPNTKLKRKINPEVSGGMNGFMYISDKPVCPLEIESPISDMAMIIKNKIVSVFYKCPSFHPHIPEPPKGVNIPEKCVSKQDVLPPPVLWHEQSAIHGRVFSERPIPNSISGLYLAKLAHRLVCEYYHARPGSQGCMQVDNNNIDVGVDDLPCQSNSRATVCGQELDGSSGNCMTNNPKKRGRETGKSSSRKRRRNNDN
ncbi:5'-3' exoribonuclease 3-like isoform X2 [Diospyros lotus]|uniref:5'-3' exoribonuclease 3-like isoform X2 n=1 Tax=Diospyros lotus TaxID=55363 RepID=UPI002252B0A7|nr:5'-3' exoribonuclease 3-like isoform X2 [Diospyros lotus]